jgi:hypothetical protein
MVTFLAKHSKVSLNLLVWSSALINSWSISELYRVKGSILDVQRTFFDYLDVMLDVFGATLRKVGMWGQVKPIHWRKSRR